ncbi:MAG: hypothetical protein D9V44_01290 [Actinobacteria bacterium]|nr:MAG: hypothetical protein D9V44_01290 [Actinomycetota bacterium]
MRELKTVTTPSGTSTTKSVWSGGQLTAELDSDGTRYTYLWGPGRIPLSVTAKTAAGVSTTYAYHTDALGSVLAMTDAAGSIVARYTYDPWGRVTSATGTAIAARNPLRYRSYYLDAETGLYYMPARYYDPTTARFLSVDPAAPSAGDPSSLNAFAYCLGDPVNAIDPSGAVIDIHGDGKLGVEDSLQQKATYSGDPADQAAANAVQMRQRAEAARPASGLPRRRRESHTRPLECQTRN